MAKVRPIHAAAIVLLFGALVVLADYALVGGFSRAGFKRVSPDQSGRVILETADLPAGEVRYYRFLNAGNQEVKFFVGRDAGGEIQVAFDANEICYKLKRGYRAGDGWMTCNKCDKAFRLEAVNEGGGGCKPVPLAHTLEGDRLVLRESDILSGWRYFR